MENREGRRETSGRERARGTRAISILVHRICEQAIVEVEAITLSLESGG